MRSGGIKKEETSHDRAINIDKLVIYIYIYIGGVYDNTITGKKKEVPEAC